MFVCDFSSKYPVAGLLRGFNTSYISCRRKEISAKKPIGVPDTGRITSTPFSEIARYQHRKALSRSTVAKPDVLCRGRRIQTSETLFMFDWLAISCIKSLCHHRFANPLWLALASILFLESMPNTPMGWGAVEVRDHSLSSCIGKFSMYL